MATYSNQIKLGSQEIATSGIQLSEPEIVSRRIHSGSKFIVLSKNDEFLLAEFHNKVSPSTDTIYWHGYVEVDSLLEFFTENFPGSKTLGLFKAVIFNTNDRLEVANLRTTNGLKSALTDRLSSESRFVRLEYTDTDPSAIDKAGFIVWSKINQPRSNIVQSAVDLIGVTSKPGWLKSIATPLANFISSTHVKQPTDPEHALRCVGLALQHSPSHSQP